MEIFPVFQGCPRQRLPRASKSLSKGNSQLFGKYAENVPLETREESDPGNTRRDTWKGNLVQRRPQRAHLKKLDRPDVNMSKGVEVSPSR